MVSPEDDIELRRVRLTNRSGQRRQIAPLAGEIPSPFALPPGCAFAGRCPRATDRCRAERPPLDGDPQQPVACFHPF